MFRTTLGALPRSLRRANPNQLAAWEQVWRRFLTSESTLQAVRQTSRVTQTPSLGLAATRRLGTTARPRLSSGQAIFRAPQRRGFRFSPWRRNKGNGAGAEESLSLTERFRKLSREYGRAAIGVYFLLSICDYPFFFLLVKAVGTERVGVVEHYIVSTVASVVPQPVRQTIRELWDSAKSKFTTITGDSETPEKAESLGRWGVEEAQERHAEEASLATQLALAYAIHKTFVFVRIPLTIAVTPRIVKKLRSWGWNIGKKINVRRGGTR